MGNELKNTYTPDYAIHPGEILEETLEARRMKKSDFAERCGLSAKEVSQIIHGNSLIAPKTAIQFERVLNVSANIWNNLAAAYRLHQAREEDKKALEKGINWVKKFPLKDLIVKGYIEKPENDVDAVQKLLDFLGIGSVDAWEDLLKKKQMQVAYRRSPSFTSDPHSVTAWLRAGEIIADGCECKPFKRTKFKNALYDIRRLTLDPPEKFVQMMEKCLAETGVVLAFVPEFRKTRLSGATRWINSNKALIMLSLRHKTDDHFWFTFFHEASHILLHGKKEIFIDDDDILNSLKEKEADSFSANFLIPENKYKIFVGRNRFQKLDIMHFSKKIGVAPGVVVGRLQHDKYISYTWHNIFKRSFEF